MLTLDHVVKRFGGVVATNDVSLTFPNESLSAIIGPNGAGKTTLFNLLSGFLKPTAGEVRLFGERVDTLKPFEIVRRGLSRSFQISSVFPTLSVRPVGRNLAALRFFHKMGFDVLGYVELMQDFRSGKRPWREGETIAGRPFQV